MGRVVKLIMVTEDNNNKFYDGEELPDGSWKATWGRVGASSSTKEYSSREWEKKYREKLAKGYKDVTDILTVETSNGSKKPNQLDTDFKAGRPAAVVEIVKRLQSYANKSVSDNYTVKVANVTQKQVDRAQNILNALADEELRDDNFKEIKETLLELYSVIPRKMSNTKLFLPDKDKNADEQQKWYKDLLFNEQQTLDVMAGQVKLLEDTEEENNDNSSASIVDIIEASGLEMDTITASEISLIKSKMEHSHHHKFSQAFKVINKTSQNRFDSHISNTGNKYCELFWHGSRNENWWSIMTTALKIRPANAAYTGSMFGDAVYFAKEFDKSLGYTSFSGSRWAGGNSSRAYLGLFNVHLGKQLVYDRHDSSCYNLSEKTLKQRGNYDSVHAKKGVSLYRDEFMVYNPAQCTIKYIVEIVG